jgi:hypothetical protein
MAQLQLQPVSLGKKNRARKAQLKIDMTPMVDLGFFLITFSFLLLRWVSLIKQIYICLPENLMLMGHDYWRIQRTNHIISR